MDDDCNDDTSGAPPTRDELIEELGRVRGLLHCLAALVVDHDVSGAHSMARALRGDDSNTTELDLGGERPKLTGWAIQHLAMMAEEHLDAMGAVNHCAWAIVFPARDGKPERTLDFVAQWSDGVTTAERIAKAERQMDELRAAALEFLTAEGALLAEMNRPRKRPEVIDAWDELRNMQKRRDAALAALRALVPEVTP